MFNFVVLAWELWRRVMHSRKNCLHDWLHHSGKIQSNWQNTVGEILELALGCFNLFHKEGFEDVEWVMRIKTGWNGAAHMENRLVVSLKVKHRITTWCSNPTPGYVPKRTENGSPNSSLYTNVLISITVQSQNVEKPHTHQLIKGWTKRGVSMQGNSIQSQKSN